MSAQARHVRLTMLYLCVAGMWGSTFLWVRIATRGASPLTVAELRLLVGAIVVSLIVRCSSAWRENRPRDLRPWVVRGVPLSLMMAAGPFVLLALAERGVPSGTAAILNSTAPLWAGMYLLIAAWLWRRPDRGLRPAAFAGLAVGALGVAVFVGPAHGGALGDELLVLLSALSYSAAGFYAAHVFRNAPSRSAAILATSVGATLLLPLGVIGWIDHPPSTPAVLASVAAGALPNGIAYVAYFALIREIGVARSISVTYLLPIVGLILGVAFLHEHIFGRELLGLVLVLAGVAAVNGQRIRLARFGRRRPAVDLVGGDLQAQSEVEVGER
jgi:drug/metabolite transporter (DMT)-like permease